MGNSCRDVDEAIYQRRTRMLKICGENLKGFESFCMYLHNFNNLFYQLLNFIIEVDNHLK